MTREVQRSEPPYLQIAAQIRRDITSGRIREGEAVPSARVIATSWNVALATATKVLAVLKSEGLVDAVPGVGTVVAVNRSGFGSGERVFATRDMGMVYAAGERAEILFAQVVEATSDAAEALAIPMGSNAIRRERVVRRGDEIVSTSVSWFHEEHVMAAPRLLQRKRIREGSFAYLEAATGVRVVRGREQYCAAGASPVQASRLGVVEGSPVLLSRNWFLTADGSVLEYGESVRIAGRLAAHEFAVA